VERPTLAALVLIALCALWATACAPTGDSEAGTAWQAAVDTLGDTIQVRTLSGSVWGDPATLIPELSIGEMDGPDHFVFGNPIGLAVTEDGRILVLDAQVPVLRMYGSDGEFIRNIGRDGSGPGEYDSPDGIGVLPDGRILVRDPRNSRIAVFDETGEYLEQWFLAGGFNSGASQVVDIEGNSYVQTILDRGVGPWDWTFGMIRYSPDGEILDTVQAPTWDWEPQQVRASVEGSSSVRSVPYSPDDHWAFSRLGYMVGGLSSDYRIDLYRTDGPVLRIERDWDPVPVRREEAQERRLRITEDLRRQYGSWRWNGPEIPSFKPPFKELFVSWEGNIWAVVSTSGVPTMTEDEAREESRERGRTPLRFTEPVVVDVFAPDGSYFGPVSTPPSFRTDPEPVIGGDHVWAVTRDELEVPRLVRFRIQTS
jgi:hypothetical protein